MLSVKDHMRLQLAGRQYRYPARREADALELLSETPPTFWLRVDELIDQPEALQEYAPVVRRLQRLREARRAARTA